MNERFIEIKVDEGRDIRKHTAGTTINDMDRIISEYSLGEGHSKKYRGKHRSQNKGAGIMAFFRSLWQSRYTHITNK